MEKSKRVRLTIGVKPEEDREKKKKVPKGGELRDDVEVQRVARVQRNVVDVEVGDVKLSWDPNVFVAEHMSMEVSPRWNPQEGWFKKDVVQPMGTWTEFTP